MSSNKKTIIISVIAIAIFIATISYASYAFYTTTITETGSNGGISGSTAKLSTTFEDEGILEIKNMIPGDSFTRTFSIENNGANFSYKIAVDNLVNEFISYQDITYTLKEDDEILEENKIFPNIAEENELSETRTIKNGEKKTYTITITYNDTEDDQTPDMGNTISGKLFIK